MRFMKLYRPADVARLDAGAPHTEHGMAERARFIEDVTRSGQLQATDSLLPTVKGARVRQSAGKVTVIDGPFTESKEVIGGFAPATSGRTTAAAGSRR